MDTFHITEGMVPEDGHDSEKDAAKLPEGANKFQRAIAAWRGMVESLGHGIIAGLTDA